MQTVYVVDYSGLARLENLYSIVNSNKHSQQTSLIVDAIRLVDVNHSYMTLRQLDSRWSSVNKYIVLDLSTEEAIHSILKQVRVNINHGVFGTQPIASGKNGRHFTEVNTKRNLGITC